jgi:hypothetical protein
LPLLHLVGWVERSLGRGRYVGQAIHADNSKIVKAGPNVETAWSEVESGHWRAVCGCGSEDVHEEPADRRAWLDPLDPSTFRHARACEPGTRLISLSSEPS